MFKHCNANLRSTRKIHGLERKTYPASSFGAAVRVYGTITIDCLVSLTSFVSLLAHKKKTISIQFVGDPAVTALL